MNDPHTGTIAEWHADKGFGFVKSGRERVFLHINDLSPRNPTPQRGDLVRFRIGRDRQGRTCAVDAVLKTPPPSRQAAVPAVRSRLGWFDAASVLGLLILPSLAVVNLGLGWEKVAAWAGVMSLLAMWACWHDKARAREGGWRISEARLHLLEFLGGWPGALLGQRYFRHKTVKVSYQITFWLIILSYQIVAFDALNDWAILRAVRGGLTQSKQETMNRR